MLLTGADIVVECLKEQGVNTVFGYPGGYVIHLYDALYKSSEHINHILTAHEQGASHAADGYARSTGKVGVCIATSGPGATNLVTGIATAYMDSTPMVCITGNVPLSMLGKDSFQEVDIAGVTTPITKHNYIVKDIKDLADTIREAFYIAQEGRPGPVLVDIPKDIQIQEYQYSKQEPRVIDRATGNINADALDKAISMIEKAEKPLIFIGGGIIKSEANKELATFVEKVNAPVTSSLMGLGGFDATHELFTGMLGMHGTTAANKGVQNCDLLIGLGTRFSERATGNTNGFAPKAKILHIDIDPAEVNKNVKADHYVLGDIKKVLNLLNEKMVQQNHINWVNEILDIKHNNPLKYNEDSLNAPYIIEKLYELTMGDAIITTEVGQHQMWAAQFYKYNQPKTLISSGGLGTMGFGLGASIGAQMANPHKKVINIAGDGCFKMNLHELATAVNYQLPITIILIDNDSLGMVRQWQTLFFGGRHSQTSLKHKTNFVGLAEDFGMKGFMIDKKEDVEATLTKALNMNEPVLVHCKIHPDEMVYPMVPPGKTIDHLITE